MKARVPSAEEETPSGSPFPPVGGKGEGERMRVAKGVATLLPSPVNHAILRW